MRTEEIIIKGMNRKNNSTEDNNGLCEEIINIRPENGSIKILGQKQVVSANLPFTEIKIHNIGNMDNYIGTYTEGGTNKIIWFDKDTGSFLQEICSFPSSSEVYFEFMNNMLVISDKTSVELIVYIFNNHKYNLFYNGLDINFSVSANVVSDALGQELSLHAPEKKIYIDAVAACVNQFRINNRQYTEGFFLVALNLTLFDNSEVNLSNLMAFIPNGEYDGKLEGGNVDFITGPIGSAGHISTMFRFNRFFNKYILSISTLSNLDKYKDIVKSVNLYASRPATNMVISEHNVTLEGGWQFGDSPVVLGGKFNITRTGLEKSELSKQILFKQRSWTLSEAQKGIIYTLEFGGEIQTTAKTLEVEASKVRRAGKMYLYNNRIHFFDSKAKLSISNKTDLGGDHTYGLIGNIYIYLRLNSEEIIIKEANVQIPAITRLPPHVLILGPMIIYPDSRAYKIVVEIEGKCINIPLKSSEAYNYAYCYTKGLSTTMDVDFIDTTTTNTYDEGDVINVTASGNPFVFPVEHSYRFDGKINDIGIITEQISDSQIGQYPLEVFTDSGIYALEQGSGSILYSNIVPINSDRAREIARTRHGIIYIANDSIYLLSGRKSVKLSEVLEGPIDFDIQNNSSYALCCQGKLYNVSDHLSKIPFKEYLKAAELSYCANTEELIISNHGHMYTYVYSFLYNAWYKLSGQYKGIKNNLLLRPVAQNTQSAKAATGSIVFENICLEKAKSFTSQCSIEFQLKSSCNAGDVVALLVDGKQIASAKFTYATKIPIIIAKLCGNIPYLEDYTYLTTDPGEVYKIHCSLSMAGKRVEIKNVNSGEFYLSKLFVQDSRVVNIGNKGYGSTITVKIGSATHAIVINNGDSIITLLNKLASEINSSTQVSAAIYANEITLTAKTSGAIGNSISLSVYNDIYTQITTRAMTGGEDISLRPSDYREIVNFSEEESGTQIIHLQTRPMLLSSTGYKALYRAMLRCKASLSGEDNLSMYIYASNDLKNWKCVQAAQRKNCTISALIVDKVYQAYKYYVLMIGGKVSNATELSSILVSLEDKLNNKLR